MQDYRNINDFRKTRVRDNFHEDPTYLSFFFMFDYYTSESPLFNGEAVDYLTNVVGDKQRAADLENFIKILKKLNNEYPWFWQSVSGLEVTKQYGNLQEPYRGADNPAIEIGCLESVELTVSGMIDLYKRAAYDFSRWVEVIPKNLRRFKLSIWVSEVRTFEQSKLEKAASGPAGATLAANLPNQNLDFLKDGSIKSVRPYFKVDLGKCQFDIDSTNSIFADLKRTPEGFAEPTIKIFYETVEYGGEYANSTINDGDKTIGSMIGDIALEKAGGVVDGAIDRVVERVKAQLLLGNVHGLNLASKVKDAFSAGSVNGIANLLRSKQSRPASIPSGFLGKAYDKVATDSEGPIKENIHDKISPDSEGPVGGNVYDKSPGDSEGPVGGNVYDKRPRDSEGPINENVYG